MENQQTPQDTKWWETITLPELWNKLRALLDIQKGCDKEKTIENIHSNNKVFGANAWMLICSILIASLGLDLNSPAVIIGAMLISPLMSPILGVGLSIGTNDKSSFKISIQNFAIYVAISLVTSSLYFLLTPYEANATPEILARTKPTFLDVLVAFFGGIAGIISGSRKEISTAIPGVAIATALMPPLCVTGFGIANLSNADVPNAVQITLNSFYLFFLNSTFIAIATYMVVRALKFPFVAFMNKQERKKTLVYMSSMALFMIIPSLFIFSSILRNIQRDRNINAYIHSAFGEQRAYIDEYQFFESSKKESNNKLVIKVYGSISRFENQDYQAKLADHHLDDIDVEILPSSDVDLDRLRRVEAQLNDVGSVLDKQLYAISATSRIKDSVISHLEQNVTDLGGRDVLSEQIMDELQTLFPEISRIGFAHVNIKEYASAPTKDARPKPILLLEWKKGRGKMEKEKDESKIASYLDKRLPSLDSIEIITH